MLNRHMLHRYTTHLWPLIRMKLNWIAINDSITHNGFVETEATRMNWIPRLVGCIRSLNATTAMLIFPAGRI